MNFEYEITADDYAASQTLNYKLTTGSKRLVRATLWMVAGIFLILIACNQPAFTWTPILLVITSGWWIYGAIQMLFPADHFRRGYQRTKLSGKKFQAHVDEEGFEIVGDLCSWRVRWPAVTVKGEDKSVFTLQVEGILFIFGKKYLTNEQQYELRRLAAIS